MAVASARPQEGAPAFQTPMYSGLTVGPAPPSWSHTRVIPVRTTFRGVGIIYLRDPCSTRSATFACPFSRLI